MGEKTDLHVRSSMCETISTIQQEILKGKLEQIYENDEVCSTKIFRVLVTTMKHKGERDSVDFLDLNGDLSKEEMEHIKDNT